RRGSRGPVPSDDADSPRSVERRAGVQGMGVAPGVEDRLRFDVQAEDVTDFFDVVLNQRACRDFSDEPVSDEHIEQMLTAATHAPSAENTQPWVFVVVRDDTSRASLSDLTRRLWSAGARDYAAAHNTPHLFNEVDSSVERGLGGAPVFVVVSADTSAG